MTKTIHPAPFEGADRAYQIDIDGIPGTELGEMLPEGGER